MPNYKLIPVPSVRRDDLSRVCPDETEIIIKVHTYGEIVRMWADLKKFELSEVQSSNLRLAVYSFRFHRDTRKPGYSSKLKLFLFSRFQYAKATVMWCRMHSCVERIVVWDCLKSNFYLFVIPAKAGIHTIS